MNPDVAEVPARPSPTAAAHREAAPDAVRCAVLTISDTRTVATDTSGALIRSLLEEEGHTIVDAAIVPDDPTAIERRLNGWLARSEIQAVITNGGTGIAARDTTYEVIARLIERRLDGFGELFRMLSYAEIGAAAMLSRAIAGSARGKLIAAMPGSTNAVRLAMERLILPELAHMVYELEK